MEYAVRMVESHYASVEDAARTCGVKVEDLMKRLGAQASQQMLARKRLFENFNR